MDIRINENWAITSDKYQFVLNRIRIAASDHKDKDGNIVVPAGGEYYERESFYCNLEELLTALPQKALKVSDLSGTLSDAVKFIKDYGAMVEAALKRR